MKRKILTSEQFYDLATKYGAKDINNNYEFSDSNELRKAIKKFEEEKKKYTIFTAVWEEGGWIIEGYHLINRISYFLIEGEYEITADIEW